jgi:putative DNA primase/helicase
MVAGGAKQGEQREVADVMDLSEPSSIADAELPDALVERDQWVCWREEQRDGKPTKVPVTPGSGGFASSTDSDTWRSFEAAVEYLETGDVEGIGFVFTEDDPIVGVDLDDCREPDTGEAEPPAPDIIDRLDSYTEVSPSGTGFHVLLKGELPEGRNRRGNVELYDSARYFTVTGKHLEGTPLRVARRQDALEAVHREYVQETESRVRRTLTDGHSAT